MTGRVPRRDKLLQNLPTSTTQPNFDPAEPSVMFRSMASILSPTMNSHEKDQSSSSTAESDDRERSDPSVNTDALPEDYPIHLEAEARTYYNNYNNGRRPPFLLNKRSEVIKTVVIPTKDGRRPKDEKAIQTNIVAKVHTFYCFRILSFTSLFIESGMAS